MALIALAPVDPNAVISAPVPAPPPKPNGLATNIVVGDNTFTPSKITVVRGTTVLAKAISKFSINPQITQITQLWNI